MRLMAAVVALTVLAALLGGCASSSNPSGSATSSSPAPSSSTAGPTPAPNHPPTATLSANRTFGAAPLAVTFSLGGSDADGDALNWTLSLGNATRTGTTLPATVNHTFAAGNATVRLTVSDGRSQGNATVTIAAVAGSPAVLPPPVTFTGTAMGACDPTGVSGLVGDPACTDPPIEHPFTVTSAVRKVTALLTWDDIPGTDLDLYLDDASGERVASSACANIAPADAGGLICVRDRSEEAIAEAPFAAGGWIAFINPYTAPELAYTLTITFE